MSDELLRLLAAGKLDDIPLSVRVWLYDGFVAYMARGVPLERALGLTGERGRSQDHVRSYYRRRRDRRLRAVAKVGLTGTPYRKASVVAAILANGSHPAASPKVVRGIRHADRLHRLPRGVTRLAELLR